MSNSYFWPVRKSCPAVLYNSALVAHHPGHWKDESGCGMELMSGRGEGVGGVPASNSHMEEKRVGFRVPTFFFSSKGRWRHTECLAAAEMLLGKKKKKRPEKMQHVMLHISWVFKGQVCKMWCHPMARKCIASNCCVNVLHNLMTTPVKSACRQIVEESLLHDFIKWKCTF